MKEEQRKHVLALYIQRKRWESFVIARILLLGEIFCLVFKNFQMINFPKIYLNLKTPFTRKRSQDPPVYSQIWTNFSKISVYDYNTEKSVVSVFVNKNICI